VSVRLVIDTCADLLPQDLGKDSEILPIPVYIDGKEYIPIKDISAHEFYEKQKTAQKLPVTSQVPLNLLYGAFKKAVLAGQEAVGIFMGSAHSGTYNSACVAKTQVEEELKEKARGKIFIVDSQNVTFPYAALVLEAERMRKEGQNAAEIAARIEYLVPRIHMRAFIDDLSFLQKGGRISALKASLGNILNFKVVIKTGCNTIEPTDKLRGIPNALRSIVETCLSEDLDRTMPLYIGYTYDEERAERLLDTVREMSDLRPAKIVEIGPTVGAHVGPGSTGLCWFVK
jgi:DegV family protein with EDD domain